MEAASENKRGRGRPSKFPAELLSAGEAQGVTTRRGQQDRIYGALVISDIMERYGSDPRRGWLVNEETARWSVLAELGRLREQRGDDAFWEAVAWVLENRPRVKEAVAVLRRYRTGKSAPGSDIGLYRALVETIDAYRSRHPETGWDQVESAIRMARDAVADRRASGD